MSCHTLTSEDEKTKLKKKLKKTADKYTNKNIKLIRNRKTELDYAPSVCCYPFSPSGEKSDFA